MTVHPEQRDEFEAIMTGNCFASIGVVVESPELTIAGLSGSIVIKAGLIDMKEVWQKTLKEL